MISGKISNRLDKLKGGYTFEKKLVSQDGGVTTEAINMRYEGESPKQGIHIKTSLNLTSTLNGLKSQDIFSNMSLLRYMSTVYAIMNTIGIDNFPHLDKGNLGRIQNPKDSRTPLTLKQLLETLQALGKNKNGNFTIYLNDEEYKEKNEIKKKVKEYLLEGYEVQGILILDNIFPAEISKKTKENMIFLAKREIIIDYLKETYGVENLDPKNTTIKELAQTHLTILQAKNKPSKRRNKYKNNQEKYILGRLTQAGRKKGAHIKKIDEGQHPTSSLPLSA